MLSSSLIAQRSLRFVLPGPPPPIPALANWLAGIGEACEVVGDNEVQLRALPVRLFVDADHLRAVLTIAPTTPLTRLLAVVWDMALMLGGELAFDDGGLPDRGALWLELADEQDRLRIVGALQRAEGRSDELLRGLWSILLAIGQGRDLRWDPHAARIVAFVRRPCAELTDEESTGAIVVFDTPTPGAHMIAWRWLTEAWPTFADG